MKLIYTLLFFSFLFINNSAYTQYERAEQAIKNAPYIFEGKVIGVDFIQDEQDVYFVSYKIQVIQSLKGETLLKVSDTIELVSEMPTGWQIFENGEFGSADVSLPLIHQKGLHLGIPMIGVFFAKKNENRISEDKFSMSFKSINNASDYFFRINYFDNYHNEIRKAFITHTINGFGLKFSSLEEFNSFLQKMQLNSLVISDKKKDVIELKKDGANAIQYANRLLKSTQNDHLLKGRIVNADFINPKSVQDVKFEILNQQITGTGVQYFEFDIFISGSSSDTYLDNSAFVIEFNTFAFGVNLSANNLVEITRGTDFNNVTYEDPMSSVTDDALNAIRFRIGTDFNGSSWNRVLLTTSQNQLAHLKIPIIDCYGFSELQFSDIVNVSFVALYTDNSNISPATAPYLAYDYVDYVQPATYALCPPPSISGFLPTTISAGTKSILTINGNGFGSQRGNSQIQFLEADNGGSSTIPYLNASDYIFWSENQIKLILPHLVDSMGIKHRPGSGIFSLKLENSFITPSPYPIDINYSVNNYSLGILGTSTFKKVPFRHVDKTTLSNGRAREFSLDTSITNNPQMAAIVKKSLETWTCVSGINWVIVDTVTQQGLIPDGKSVIFLTDYLIQGDTTLGITESQVFYQCSDEITSEKFVYASETDIAFARYENISSQVPVKWFFDTTLTVDVANDEIDFYHTAIHELGHAHYLGHVNNTYDVMSYVVSSGPINAANRLQLYTSQGAIDGGIHVTSENFALSVTSCGGTINNTTPQYAQFCGDLGLFGNKKPKNGNVNLYPNPFNETLNLSFELVKDSEAYYSVYDLYGRIVCSKDMGYKLSGTSTEIIELASYSSGIYMVSVKLGAETFNYKVIKR